MAVEQIFKNRTFATTRTTIPNRTVQIERLHILPLSIARLKNIKVNQAILGCVTFALCLALAVDGGLPTFGQFPLGPYPDRVGRDGVILRFEERKVVGKVLDEHFLELDGHGRALVHLHGEHAVERPALLVEVNQVGGRMPVDQ